MQLSPNSSVPAGIKTVLKLNDMLRIIYAQNKKQKKTNKQINNQRQQFIHTSEHRQPKLLLRK